MPHRRAHFLAFVAVCPAWGHGTSIALAADKTSLACIRAAEDGQAARDESRLLRARDLFTQCASRDCPSLVRHDCAGWLDEAEAQIPSIVLVARDATGRDRTDARVTIDGLARQSTLAGSAIDLDPGLHLLRIEIEGSEPIDEQIVLSTGEKNRVVNVASALVRPAKSLPPSPSPSFDARPARSTSVPIDKTTADGRRLPLATYLFGGAGIAALGVFGYFGIRGMADADHLRQTCAPDCSHADVNAVHARLVVADVALGVGVVSLAAASFFIVRALAGPSHSSSQRPSLLGVSGNNGNVVVRF
jgi:hypothetical protein